MLEEKIFKLVIFVVALFSVHSLKAATNSYLTNQSGDSVSIVDIKHDQKLIDISLPNVAGVLGPTAVITTLDGRFVITANYNESWSGSVTILDTSNYKTRELRFSDNRNSFIARGPAGITISQDGTKVLISTNGGVNELNKKISSLVILDISELIKVGSDIDTVKIPFGQMNFDKIGGSGIAYDSTRQLAYIAQDGYFDGARNFIPTNLVSVIDLSKVTDVTDLSKAHVTQLSSKSHFVGPVEVKLNNNDLYVANHGPMPLGGGAKTVTLLTNIDKIDITQNNIDLDKNKPAGMQIIDLPVTPWPTGMTFFNNKLYLTSLNEPQFGSAIITLIDNPATAPQFLEIIHGIDQTTDKYYDGLKARNRIYDIAVTADGKKILVAGQPWYVHKEDAEKLGSLYIIDHSATEGKLSGIVDLDGQRGRKVKKIETGLGTNGLALAKDIPLTLDLPKELKFTTKVNTTSEVQKVSLKNNASIVLHLLKVAPDPDVFTIEKSSTCKDRLIAGESCSLDITFRPKAFNTFNGTLTFTTNADNGDVDGKLVVKLTGIAVDDSGNPGPIVTPTPTPDPNNPDTAEGGGGNGCGCHVGAVTTLSSLLAQGGLFVSMFSLIFWIRRNRKE